MIRGNKEFILQWVMNPYLREKIKVFKSDDLICDVMTYGTYKTKKQNAIFHQLLDEFWKSGHSSFDDPDELRRNYKKMAGLIKVDKAKVEGYIVIKETEISWAKVPKKQATIAIDCLINDMFKSGVNTKQLSNPVTLELAKIVVDTSYYGWLINYAQLSNMIAIKHKVHYDEMWSFADEIHKFLGNRPKMYPGFIGGHCVIPNLELIKENSLYEIDKINNMYASKVKNSKLIRKKYDKSKKSSFDSSKVQ